MVPLAPIITTLLLSAKQLSESWWNYGFVKRHSCRRTLMRARSSGLPRLKARVLKAVLGLIEAAWWRCAAAAAGRKRC
jgi:hypothetical protein